ncbi:hypothetical protein like AT1G58430 [Hibiscus trionum]|uniref:Uncharacterized protein n=1 Tax=Hibiscus trionum TaxID=183268 RepID=A0A9W7ID05_HIBTR|nr:hypothetical protein like AT1G58430 [Hibiscus trionum]
MQTLLPEMKAKLAGTKLAYADIYDTYIFRPIQYGIRETSVGCCGSGLLEVSILCNAVTASACGNPSEHLFWDSVQEKITLRVSY